MRETSIDRLQVSLQVAMEEWAEREADDEHWADVGYVSENLTKHMAIAAMAVLRASIDLNQYLEKEQMVK